MIVLFVDVVLPDVAGDGQSQTRDGDADEAVSGVPAGSVERFFGAEIDDDELGVDGIEDVEPTPARIDAQGASSMGSQIGLAVSVFAIAG